MKNPARSTWALALVLAAGLAAPAFAGLVDYVNKPDASYQYEVTAREESGASMVYGVRMRSQTWQNIPWEHWVIIVRPNEIAHPDAAMLLIDGGDNGDGLPDLNSERMTVLKTIAAQTKSVTAMVRQVPNQPLFGGLTEDQIIAFTYDKFLKGEGEDWPLLLPMVKSAVRAMDTVSAVVEEETGNQIKRFMLTGGSKRGWTTWLSAVADERVKRIAPFVIDVLNMQPQMEHQMKTYGGYSSQVEDYTRLNIQARMGTPEGQVLLGIVDPYSYREQLTLPKLIVLGANDPYWTVDAAGFYFPELKGEKYLYYQANTGHDVNMNGIASVSQFYMNMLTGGKFPELTWETTATGALHVKWSGEDGKATVWQALSMNRDFRDMQWHPMPLPLAQNEIALDMKAPPQGYLAYFVEVRFPSDFGIEYGLSTPMVVKPDTFPKTGRAYDSPAK